MSLNDDFKDAQCSPEQYLRRIWGETEIMEDVFDGVDFGFHEDVERVVLQFIHDEEATETRKNLYRKLVLEFVNQKDGETFDGYCQNVEYLEVPEPVKWNMLAHLFTRVLRGELVLNREHRTPANAVGILGQGHVDPWCARLDELIALEKNLELNMGV